MSYTHPPPFTFLVSLPLNRWGNWGSDTNQGLRLPHGGNKEGSPDVNLVCLTSEPDDFSITPCQGGRVATPMHRCLPTKRRRFPGPCGLPEKQRGGVLPESKLERKPSWHFIWIVSHMCRNWWKEMSFKGPSGSTVKWLWDSLETVAHAAEFKLGRKVAGYVRHKQSETGRSFCLFSHFKFSGFLFLSHSKVTLICVLSYVTTENWDRSKYVLWPLEIIPRTHFYCSRKTFLIYGEVNKGWYV